MQQIADDGPVGTEAFQPQTRTGPHVRRFDIVVIQGPDTGKTYACEKGRAVIGTAESADLALSDRTVSRFHTEIMIDQGAAWVRDLGSRNGTLVSGISVEKARVENGYELALGRTIVRVDLRAEQVAVPVSKRDRFGTLVGGSPAMRQIFAMLEHAASCDATVLLEGETGTGKEATTESIHLESARQKGPLVVVDCGAIPPDLLESELFGHERGAFTGAVATRKGAFENASGGTIFLDEIGELSPDLQPKLLRVLERREVKRIGSNQYFGVDVRVVGATNRNLRTAVNEHRFRSDLYYRLAVIEIRLPPLRERIEDLPALVEHLLEGLGAASHPAADTLRTNAFRASIARHTWPGNVRELRNYVERCLAMRERVPLASPQGEPDPELVDDSKPFREARDHWSQVCERRYLQGLLARHDGNVTAAARAAGVDRMYLYRLLWRHSLR